MAVSSAGVAIPPGRPTQERSIAGAGQRGGRLTRWAPAAAGAALALYGLTRGSGGGLAVALVGGTLAYRSVKRERPRTIEVDKSVTIDKPREEVFRFWRNLESLPRFMKHLDSVRATGDRRSHWVAKAPAGMTVEWDAEIIAEEENELIGWRSLEKAEVENAGTVRFREVPGGRGTEVHVSLRYNPPAGAIGAAFARLFGEAPEQQIEEDLRRLKQIMEAGEIATTEGQPAGRRETSLLAEDNLRRVKQVMEAGGVLAGG